MEGDSFYIRNYDPYSADTYFEITYMNGIHIRNGFANGQKGIDGPPAKVKDALDAIITAKGQKYYLFSLKSDVIESRNVLLKNGTTVSLSNIEKQTIDPSQVILLECEMMSWNESNMHYMHLKYLNAYDVWNGVFPADYINHNVCASKLVE